jgi:hypothetical protein
MDSKETIYVGKGKVFDTKFGGVTSISVCLDDMFAYAKDNIEPAKNGKKYIKLAIMEMKAPDNYNNTHTVKIDTYKKPEATDGKLEGVPF